MDKFRLFLGASAEPDIGPPGLEILEVGAGRNFPVLTPMAVDASRPFPFWQTKR